MNEDVRYQGNITYNPEREYPYHYQVWSIDNATGSAVLLDEGNVLSEQDALNAMDKFVVNRKAAMAYGVRRVEL